MDEVTKDPIELPMSCVCSSNREDVITLRDRAAKILELDFDTRYQMSSHILYALTAWFSPMWDLKHVATDMWMMVSIEQWTTDGTGDKVQVQCDYLEDGLVALFLHVYDNYERDE